MRGHLFHLFQGGRGALHEESRWFEAKEQSDAIASASSKQTHTDDTHAKKGDIINYDPFRMITQK